METSAPTSARWRVAGPAPADVTQRFASLDPLTVQLLWNRGFIDDKTTPERLQRVLRPDFEAGLHNPMLLPNMMQALDRIDRAIEKGEKICVFGDYDADGVPGAALLIETLQKLTPNVSYYIPAREDEGYGLTDGPLKKLQKRGEQLIITVDCGIKNATEVAMAQAMGMDVIVTDHHEVPEAPELPNTIVVHARLVNSKYPYGFACGAGISYKLASAIVDRHREKFAKGFEKWLLDLVAIATISDMVPLVDENRVLAYYGMIVLRKSHRKGLQALLRHARIVQSEMNSSAISYAIGPRLNAPGRLGKADESLLLLLTDDEREAERLALHLTKQNATRQRITQTALAESIEQIEALPQLPPIIVVKGDWHKGVLGIVAGKLKERYLRPVFVMAEEQDELRGSARGIEGFDLSQVMTDCSDILLKGGGHKMAAGFSLLPENEAAFRQRLAEIGETIDPSFFNPVTEVDAELNFTQISPQLWRQLELLEPFGVGNARPSFLSRNVEMVRCSRVGKTADHLRLTLRQGGVTLQGILFGHGAATPLPEAGCAMTIHYEIELSKYMGRERLQLAIDSFEVAQ